MSLSAKHGEGLVTAFLLICSLLPSIASAAELQQETVSAWDAYIQAKNARMESRLHGGPFLWVDEGAARTQQVRGGKILVSPAAEGMPIVIPGGLVHDWVGAAFIPHATLEDVLSVVRDYDDYKVFYNPTVVDSRTLGLRAPEPDKFSMLLANNQVLSRIGLYTEYEACYQHLSKTRLYSEAVATRVQEIRNYGRQDQQELRANESSGYIWRLFSFSRFEERDSGVYVEIEAIALSRDIPAALRWLINPIVRGAARNSLLTSLRQTEEAVRLVTKNNRLSGQSRPTLDSCKPHQEVISWNSSLYPRIEFEVPPSSGTFGDSKPSRPQHPDAIHAASAINPPRAVVQECVRDPVPPLALAAADLHSHDKGGK